MNKKLLYGIPLVVIVMAVAVFAAVSYFHQVPVTLTVSEARSSADLPVILSGYSGQSQIINITIHNAASVPLCSRLIWEETTNTDNVTYSTSLPQNSTLAPLVDTIIPVEFDIGQATNNGTVSGRINYESAVC